MVVPLQEVRGERQAVRFDGIDRVILRDAAGELFWRSGPLEPNSFGSFTVELSRSFLPPGEYSLELEGSTAGATDTLETYRLRVLASPPPEPAADPPDDAPT